ncbi:MAG: single-stranded-DNA-specific exonuclease RecJ [Alphaproteobacteria bacterium]|nr:single-stranded-DNA-specific exonuclease RecJ [Alphaproteobacteria bacterium]
MKKIVEKSMLGKAWMLADDVADENNDLVKKILVGRGIVSDDDIQKFLNPSIKDYMPNPSVLTDMDKAAVIIADAIEENKKIAIYGDYDVDGITSTAIFVKFLRQIGVDVVWHLPTREGEGYGLNNNAIEEIAQQGVKLIITVDCGISGIDEVDFAHNLGLQIVVTDHHSPDTEIPNADALVNPKRHDDTSGLSYLAGVGVAFLTLVAVNRELKKRGRGLDNSELMNSMDLVALGTICDTMLLIGLNRAFVATGLKVMGLRKNLGLRVLMDVAKISRPSVYAAGFALGPRLNAAGRLDSALPALELLLTDNPLIANDLADKLHKMNQERIDIQNAIMLRATEMAEKCCADGKCSLFVCGDNWHGGVMGIIAGRLKDKFNLPSCVATRADGVINGSGRSIPGVDLGKIIHDALAEGVVSEGGGHAAAAGFSLQADKEADFCRFLEAAVVQQLNGQLPPQEVVADAEIDSGGANMRLVKQMKALEPFGQGNPEPTLILRGGILGKVSVMGSENQHLRGVVKTSAGTKLVFVAFNMTGTAAGKFLLDDANQNTKIMLLGKLKDNEHNGRVSVQFVVEDVAI